MPRQHIRHWKGKELVKLVKNVPSPCCGSYDILIKSEIKDGILYHAECAECGFGTKEGKETKQEAIYDYERLCIDTWKRNPSGLLDWMKKKPKDAEDVNKRVMIEEDVRKHLGM